MSQHDSVTQGNESVDLRDEERVRALVAESVLALWEVVNNLTRLRPTRRSEYRVTMKRAADGAPS